MKGDWGKLSFQLSSKWWLLLSGWNRIRETQKAHLLRGDIVGNSVFFFPHSYWGSILRFLIVLSCKHSVWSVMHPARVYATSYAILSCTCSNVKPEMFMNCKQPESSLIWRTNHWKTRCSPCFHGTHPGRSMQLQRTPWRCTQRDGS